MPEPTLDVDHETWCGLADGRLRCRQVNVAVRGRGAAQSPVPAAPSPAPADAASAQDQPDAMVGARTADGGCGRSHAVTNVYPVPEALVIDRFVVATRQPARFRPGDGVRPK
jgi:hypothetical protein